QLVSQLAVLDRYVVPVQRASRLQYLSVAQAVREQGLGQPVILVGYTAAPIAFSAGCTDVPTITDARQLKEAARRSDVGVLTTRRAARAFSRGWPHNSLR